jgi:hypothetical protein
VFVDVVMGSSLGHHCQLCGRAEFCVSLSVARELVTTQLANPSLVVVEVSCVLMWPGSGSPD